MSVCKLCLKEKKLIDAHIIPKGFFKHLYPNEEKYPGSSKKSLMVLHATGKNMNSWIGEYDQNILCAECDGQLGVYDDYAQTILLKTTPDNIHERATQIILFDYKKLKLFFMSLLWRASISTRDFFRMINVGPFEEKLRVMIIDENVGGQDDFTVLFSRFSNNNPNIQDVADLNITTPLPLKFNDGVRAIVFYFPGRYKVYIKTDSRSFNEDLVKVSLTPDKPLYILDAGQFEASPEFKKMVEVAYKDHPEIRPKSG